MKKFILLFALSILALPLAANPSLFAKYESARQALLKNSLPETQKAATALASSARGAKNSALAARAESLAKSKSLDAAREAFAAVSDEMIKVRDEASGPRPSVYYCSMAKKSWLQQKGTVGNPYEPDMPTCGELKAE